VTQRPALNRRSFLSQITATAIGGTSALVLTPSLVQASTELTTEKTPENLPKNKGYQRTEHVNTYYQLADF